MGVSFDMHEERPSYARRLPYQLFLTALLLILFPFPGLGQANSSGMFPFVFADFCGGVSDHPPVLSGILAAFFAFLALVFLLIGVCWAFWKKEWRIAVLFEGMVVLSYLAATLSAAFHPTLALESGLFLGFMGLLPSAFAFAVDIGGLRSGAEDKGYLAVRIAGDILLYVASAVALLLLVAALTISLFFVLAGISGQPFALVAGGLGL